MAGYTRQSSFSDGDTITAALFNNEYNQLVNAFNVSSGHTHDGSTTGDGGPISNLFSNALVFGTNAESDIAITFNAASNDGVLTWKEDEDYFEFSDDLLIATTEKIQFRDTAIYINSSTDGQLDLVADTEIQIAATTIDMNGAADISGNLAVGGNLTVTGNATISGNLTFGDAASDTVAFSADVASHLLPSADNTYDLGASGSEWKDLYIDGVAYVDAINFNGTAISATAAELNILDGVTSTAAELNILDGVTSTAAELNILDGVTSTAAELNILDGVTSTAAELNILDGVTASATDINLIDGITNGTVIASKAIITDSNKDITGGRNITISGELDAATLDISGDADIDGTLEADAITIGGVTLAETISDTVGAMVTSNTESGITVAYDDSDNTLDFTVGTLNQNTTGTAATVTTAAQPNITSLGTLTTLTVDNVIVNGTTIGHTDDTDLMTLADGVLTVAGEVSMTTLDIGGTNVTSTAAELNILDGATVVVGELNYLDLGSTAVGTAIASKAVVLDSNKDYTGLRNLTITGELDAATLDVSGDVDIDGTLEADAITVNGTALASVIAGTTVSNATLAATTTVTDSTANTNFPVVFHDESNGLLDDTGALRYNPSTGELLVPKLTVAGTTTTADTVTMEASNAIIFEGATADSNETTLSIVDPTADHTQYLINQGGYIPVLAAATTTAITSTPAELNILDGVTSTATELNLLDGSTANTVVNSKAVVYGSSGELAGTLSTAAQTNITSLGTLSTLTVDDITINGSTISDSGDLTVDVGGDIILDAAGDQIRFKDAGTEVGHINMDSSNLTIRSSVSDKDIIFTGNDGGSSVTALTLDMSEAGAATFNKGATFGGDITISEGTPAINFTDTDNNYDASIAGLSGSLVLTADANAEFGTETIQFHTGGSERVTIDASGNTTFTGTINGVGIAFNITNFSNSLLISNDAGTGTLDSASNNTGVGFEVFDDLTSGDNNTGFGERALTSLTTGSSNTAIGREALKVNTTASNNTAVGKQALASNTTGAYNTAVGTSALTANTTADFNTAVGRTALAANTTGASNVAVGGNALDANTTGSTNTALGTSSLTANTTADNNTAVGASALAANTTADNNTAVGKSALTSNTTGFANTALGSLAGDALTTGNNNIAIGVNALGADTLGDRSVAIGNEALLAQNFTTTTDVYNVAVGYQAGTSITTGTKNTAVGGLALQSTTTGIDNVGVGYGALNANTTASNNTAVGNKALLSNTTGTRNTAVGSLALDANTTANDNIAIGYDAATANTTGAQNTVVGTYAFDANTTGSNNTAIGRAALSSNTTASSNTAVGHSALETNTTGSNNTAVGLDAGRLCSTGDANTFVGQDAGEDITTGDRNTVIGVGAGANATTLDDLTAVGYFAGGTAVMTGHDNTCMGTNALTATTSGASNTAIGRNALTANTTASDNTTLGKDSGESVTTGGGNTLIGSQAGDVITTGTDNVCIGLSTDPSGNGAVNQIVIGHNISGGENSQFTFGKASNVVQNEFDTDAAWTRTSDIRKKRNVNDDNLGLSFINNLRPVTFQWKPSNEFPKEWDEYSEENNMNLDAVIHGMIAQEVKEALDKEGVDTFGGWKERKDGSQSISREMFITPLINAVQQLSTQVDELKAEIQTLKEE